MSDVLDRDRFEFEREKWRADLTLRDREIAVKERDHASSKWRNPLVVAVFAAAFAAIGNASITFVNGWLQRDLEATKSSAELKLEESKAESARILEMIKTGDTERAASNMEFLLKSGLVANEVRSARLGQYLRDRRPGTGPSLPAATRFGFEPTEALTTGTQKILEELIGDKVAARAWVAQDWSAKRGKAEVDNAFLRGLLGAIRESAPTRIDMVSELLKARGLTPP